MDKSSVVETSDSHTLPCSIRCCSELNEVPTASQLVVATYKVAVEWKDKQGELVTGKERFIPLHFSDSKRHKA